MPITNRDTFIGAGQRRARKRVFPAQTTGTATAFSALDMPGTPAAGSLTIGNTTTGLVPTDATAGYPDIRNFGAGTIGYLSYAAFNSTVAGTAILYDRIWHAGSVLATALATTTFAGQPSYASRLPGGTDYGDLEILLEINTAFSATATTVSVGYTNEAGVTGRVAASGSLSSIGTRRVISMPLQAGDKAPQRIDSIIIGGVVATAGSVNVILARRLADFTVYQPNRADAKSWNELGQEVFADMALWGVIVPDGASSGLFGYDVTIRDG